LNTGGIRLNPQELRNALYPGQFNAMLIGLARSRPFTEIWGIPPYVVGEELEPSDALLRNAIFASLADAELVLRFFALRDAVEKNKSGSLRTILDRFMESQSSVGESGVEAMQTQFTQVLTRLRSVFGEVTFRLKDRGRLSRPLYDALMIALSQDPTIDVESNAVSIRQALDQALGDEDAYEILVGRGNTIAAVHERVALAKTILTTETR